MGIKMCKNGCGRQSQRAKDGLCRRCWKEAQGLPVRAPQAAKAAGGGVMKAEPKSIRAKGRAEAEHHAQENAEAKELISAAKGVAQSAFSLGVNLGELTEHKPQPRTRITIVTMDVYGPSPLEGLIPILEALEGLRGR